MDLFKYYKFLRDQIHVTDNLRRPRLRARVLRSKGQGRYAKGLKSLILDPFLTQPTPPFATTRTGGIGLTLALGREATV